MGQSGAWTAEVFFDDVRVPADALIGEEGRGLRQGADRALPRPAAHRRALRRHGPAGARRVGRLRRDGQAGRRPDRPVPAGPGRCSPTCTPSCWPAAAWSARSPPRYDSGADTSVGPSSAKLFCTEMVGRAADRAVQVHGGLGYLRTTPVERFYRDARLFRLYEGTSEVQRVIIGGALLREAGMPRG